MRIVLEFNVEETMGRIRSLAEKKLSILLNSKSKQIALMILSILFLTGCSAWQEDFEQKPVRGMPKASIHEISTKIDKGEIREDDIGSVRAIELNSRYSGNTGTYFSDGKVSRGYEEVHRIFIAEYEDENGNLHSGHNLYIVVKPAKWTFHKG